MTRVLPRNFRRASEAAIASYSFIDLATQTGFVTFYGLKDEDSYRLVSNTSYSDQVMTVTTAASTSDTVQHDLDFDVLFNAPQTLRGELIANIPFLIRNTAGAARSFNVYAKIYVRKWNGTTETEIANDTGATVAWGGTTTANGAQERGMLCVSVTIPNGTHYKRGEYLRITVELHAWANAAGNVEYIVGHDPRNRATDLTNLTLSGAGRTFNTDPSNMIFQVPFKLDR